MWRKARFHLIARSASKRAKKRKEVVSLLIKPASRKYRLGMTSIGEPRLLNAPVFETNRVAIGLFRCPVEYPDFRDTGPIDRCIVVFPRTSVWIRHEGARPFLADPTIATIYNRAQRYERFPASREGDRCDWFAVSDDLAREIAAAADDRSIDSELPFHSPWAKSDGRLYLHQRALFRRARNGVVDALEAEEGVIGIVAAVLGATLDGRVSSHARRRSADVRRRELAEAAKLELERTVGENRSVHEIASSLGTSPFHLCRIFRACTGRTLNAYRSELRVRLALEMLEAPAVGALSRVAHTLGFASHSHFVQTMRRHWGTTPGAARALVS